MPASNRGSNGKRSASASADVVAVDPTEYRTVRVVIEMVAPVQAAALREGTSTAFAIVEEIVERVGDLLNAPDDAGYDVKIAVTNGRQQSILLARKARVDGVVRWRNVPHITNRPANYTFTGATVRRGRRPTQGASAQGASAHGAGTYVERGEGERGEGGSVQGEDAQDAQDAPTLDMLLWSITAQDD